MAPKKKFDMETAMKNNLKIARRNLSENNLHLARGEESDAQDNQDDSEKSLGLDQEQVCVNSNTLDRSKVDQGEPSRSKVDQGEPSRAKSVQGGPSQAGPSRSKVVQGEPSRSKVVQGEPSRSKVVQGEPSQSKVGQGEPSQSEVGQGEPRWSKVGQGEPVYSINTKNQFRVASLLSLSSYHKTSRKKFSVESGVPEGSVRRILENLMKLGFIEIFHWRSGTPGTGLDIKLLRPIPIPETASYRFGPFEKQPWSFELQKDRTQRKVVQGEPSRSKVVQGEPSQSKVVQGEPRWSKVVQGEPSRPKVGQGEPSQSKVDQGEPSLSKIDRLYSIYLNNAVDISDDEKRAAEQLLGLTDEDFSIFWPELHEIGFGEDQIEQIIGKRLKAGKSIKQIQKSLDYAEHYVENGIKDPKGKPYGLGAFFSGLVRNGCWNRPAGYKSPEEAAAEEELEESRRIAQLRKEAETIRKEEEAQKHQEAVRTWRDSLSESEWESLKAKYGSSTAARKAFPEAGEKKGVPFDQAWNYIYRKEKG
jgi:hypothetical protein